MVENGPQHSWFAPPNGGWASLCAQLHSLGGQRELSQARAPALREEGGQWSQAWLRILHFDLFLD